MDEMIKALKEAYDLQTCKDIVQHGCVSGVCHNHIYYSQTSSFYDMYEAEVLSIVMDSMGDNYPACLFVENDYDLVGYKNAIVWCAIECFANDVIHTHLMMKRINWDNKDFNSLANCLYKELES